MANQIPGDPAGPLPANAHPDAPPITQEPSSAPAGSGDCGCPPPEEDPGDWQEEPGATVGRYKLLQRIGEGGFGVVYMAEQREPVRRKVALKLIKPGMDTRAVIARFEAERQALAMMDHANIARVFDAGTTRQGRPYFVMELVKGVPITTYCDTENLTTRQRLELFVQVCQAVQHAHQKGIIHRDVKPSNVMVTLHDGRPVPKVIDFGIAKATNAELTARTLFTEFRQFIGTPEYMSPEQAEMSGLDIDTRTDIYSLGVLLYELLTGTTPFQGERLRSAALDEIQRIIREEEPERPSTRISHLHAEEARSEKRGAKSATGARRSGPAGSTGVASTADAIARRRRTDPRHLTRELRGDLDWIIMKALEKDRTRRYPAASDLAEDIERHMKDQPVTAGPPSAAYRMRKFYRRHQGRVLAAAAVLLMFLLGLAGTSWGMIEARQLAREAQAERDRAEVERDRAENERQRAEAAMAETELAMAETKKAMAATDAAMRDAQEQAAIAEAVNRFLNEDLLASVAPDEVGREVTVLQVLERAAGQIDQQYADRPAILATLHHTIGKSYMSLGRLDESQHHLDRAVSLRRRELGDEHRDTIAVQSSLASVFLYRGRYTEAEGLYRILLERARNVLGPDHVTTIGILNNYAVACLGLAQNARAEELLTEARAAAERSLGSDHPVTIKVLGSLSNLAEDQGRYEESERLLREVLERQERALGKEHVDTLLTRSNLAMLDQRLGRPDTAAPLLEEVLAARRRLLGNDHPETFGSITNLALVYRKLARQEDARRLLEEALDIGRRILGERHPHTMIAAGSLGELYDEMGLPEQAEPLLKLALEGLASGLGMIHPETLAARADLLAFYRRAGRAEEIERVASDYLLHLKRAAELPDASAYTLNTAAYELVTVEPVSLREPEIAVAFARRACDLTGNKEPYLLDTLACALAAAGDPEQAIEIQKRALELTAETDPGRPEMLTHLSQFEAAARARAETAPPGSD